MNINIIGPEPELEAFGVAAQRILRFGGNETQVDLYTDTRKTDGWLEYRLDFHNGDGKRIMLIGMIQRAVGQPWEFHS